MRPDLAEPPLDVAGVLPSAPSWTVRSDIAEMLIPFVSIADDETSADERLALSLIEAAGDFGLDPRLLEDIEPHLMKMRERCPEKKEEEKGSVTFRTIPRCPSHRKRH